MDPIFHFVIAATCLSLHLADAGAISVGRYGLVVDVGSSGSRVRVYQWTDAPGSVPSDISEVYNYKVYPGFSTLADNPDGVQPYVMELLVHAQENVPTESQSTTPLYFLATAGMRLLPEESATALMDAANAIFLDPTLSPFLYVPVNTRILSGEEEGAFAWISANYLRGYFTGESTQQAGIVEMGGASSQIAFVPDGSVLDGLFPVTLAGQAYNLYSRSYLDYGQTEAENWVETYMWRAAGMPTDMDNPCMLHGQVEMKDMDGVNVTMSGTGDADECLAAINHLVYTVKPAYCHPSPCAIGPFYQPDIPDDMFFYGLSAFVYLTNDLDQMYDGRIIDENGTMDPRAILAAAHLYCQQDYEVAAEMTMQDPQYATGICFQGLYFGTLLLQGLGFNHTDAYIETVSEINGQSIEWSLGALIYECMA